MNNSNVSADLIKKTEEDVTLFFESNRHASNISCVASLGYGKCRLGYDALNLVIEKNPELSEEDMMDIRSDLDLLSTDVQIECVFDKVSNYPYARVIW